VTTSTSSTDWREQQPNFSWRVALSSHVNAKREPSPLIVCRPCGSKRSPRSARRVSVPSALTAPKNAFEASWCVKSK